MNFCIAIRALPLGIIATDTTSAQHDLVGIELLFKVAREIRKAIEDLCDWSASTLRTLFRFGLSLDSFLCHFYCLAKSSDYTGMPNFLRDLLVPRVALAFAWHVRPFRGL